MTVTVGLFVAVAVGVLVAVVVRRAGVVVGGGVLAPGVELAVELGRRDKVGVKATVAEPGAGVRVGLAVMAGRVGVGVRVAESVSATVGGRGAKPLRATQARPLQINNHKTNPSNNAPARPPRPERVVSKVIGPAGWRPRRAAKARSGPTMISSTGANKINKIKETIFDQTDRMT